MNVDETMDLAEDAQEKLLASLKSLTSKNLGKIRQAQDDDWMVGGAGTQPDSGVEDPYDWMEEDEEEEDYIEEEGDFYHPSDDDEQDDSFEMMEDITTMATPKRRVLHRADTPIISNTKKIRVGETSAAPLIVKRSLPSVYSTHEEFRQYHQALEHWLVVMKSRADDDKESQLQFLNTLNQICWRDGGSTKEGNFWLLLRFLREKGGADAVLWDDSLDHRESIANYTADIAQRTWLSPASILKACCDDQEAPTALYRLPLSLLQYSAPKLGDVTR